MTNHLAAIREAAKRIVANGREEWMGDKVLLLISSRLHGQEILRIMDEAEKDSTCKVLFTDFGDPYCSECGSREIHSCDTNFCPDCGRRIVKEGAE